MRKGGVCGIRTYESNQTIHIEFRRIVAEDEMYDSEALFMPFDENGEDSDLPKTYRMVKGMGGILSLMTDYGYLTYAVSLPVYGSTSLIQPPEREPDFRENADLCFEEDTHALRMQCFTDLFERRVRSQALEAKEFSLLLCRVEILEKESSFGYLNNELMQRVIEVLDTRLRHPWRWMAKVDFENPCRVRTGQRLHRGHQGCGHFAACRTQSGSFQHACHRGRITASGFESRCGQLPSGSQNSCRGSAGPGPECARTCRWREKCRPSLHHATGRRRVMHSTASVLYSWAGLRYSCPL